MRKSIVILMAIATSLALAKRAGAEDKEYGRRLAGLRAEVDDLEARLERMRSEAGAERRSLEIQKGDLEVLLRKEQVRHETLKRLRAQQIAERRKVESWATRLMQPAGEAAARLRKLVLATLPFKREERLSAIDEILAGLEGPGADPVLALSRLWQLAEDEVKLTAESGLHRQVIELEGERLLVEVVRLGMAVLYFKTPDGRVGWAVPTQGGHCFQIIDQPDRVEAVLSLFGALRKQIRKGFFELPLPSSPGGIHHAE
jgi:hypothetical protein